MGDSDCCHRPEHAEPDAARVAVLQARFDALLAGQVDVEDTEANSRLFSPFSSEDKVRAQVMAGLCTRIAERAGGLDGIAAALDELYSDLRSSPKGMVQHAAKLFLTHFAPARNVIAMRSLEERQPGLAAPRVAVPAVKVRPAEVP